MDARSRMEARRRKILMNAEARMNKIMGKPYEMKDALDAANVSGERNICNGFLNGEAATSFENEISTTAFNARLNDSVLLGILTRLSYFFGLSWIFNENLLYPFLIAGVPWAILNSGLNFQASGILPSLLLFTGVQQLTVLIVYKIIAFFRTLTQYFSLYLFCFIIIHCIVESTAPTAKP
uniref:Uncharacterized protein n=1 Tax=Rhodnius prolixus TaxID=13249 RepID=T1IF25_RHOPR